MAVALVTGSCGLVGSGSVSLLDRLGYDVVGVDNDMRPVFLGEEASTVRVRERLEREHRRYRHYSADVRDAAGLQAIVRKYGRDIDLVIHAAAQPSHDWAKNDPRTDFEINATGTLNLLEAVRLEAPEALFLFMSTSKVYGDESNRLPLVELETRWEVDAEHPAHAGIDEKAGIDQTTHSLFGVSKAAADLMVQEYNRYFGLKTVTFRAGCISGPNHAGAELHGFIAYLLKCTCTGRSYSVLGFKGKQVRDNLHSADLVRAFQEVLEAPRPGEVYNIGGGRRSHCSVIEAIALCEEISGQSLSRTYEPAPRIGDQIWYVTDLRKFQAHYPNWDPSFSLRGLVTDIYEKNGRRWESGE